MPIDITAAYKIERPPVEVGKSYPFYSTLEGVDGYGIQCRKYTGQTVFVINDETDPEAFQETRERIFKVRAADGTEFSAWEGELNDWFFDTGQYYSTDGKWHRG
jgi:hypothetical protein